MGITTITIAETVTKITIEATATTMGAIIMNTEIIIDTTTAITTTGDADTMTLETTIETDATTT